MQPTSSNNFGYQLGLIGFPRFSNILKLFHYAIDIHPRYFLRLLLLVGSSLICLPLRLWERVVYGKKIEQTQIKHSPIFIIGHWRSGTTYLHNLMSQSQDFGYLTMYQAVIPDCSLVGKSWLKPLLAKVIPLKRPMDNVTWPMDSPQEEEIPLAKTMTTSFYIHFLFPKKTQQLFRKYVLMEDDSAPTIAEFKRKYYRLLQIATIHAKGKPLILKNPVNTARVKFLLELFPDAKFIHIYRSPYNVFKSSRTLHRTLNPITTLQTLDNDRAEGHILTMYEEMMQKYLNERVLIPKENLVEVRFESLEEDPMAEIRRIYQVLSLPEYENALPHFQSYIEAQRSYKKNQTHLCVETKQKIEARWQFAFSTFKYPLDTTKDSSLPLKQP